MSKIRGMLTVDQLVDRAASGAIDTVIVAFSDLHGRWMGKRYDVDFFIEDAAEHGAHVCDYLLTTDMGMNPVPGYEFASWERGYGDVHLLPDMASLRVASWLEKTAIVLCDVAARDGQGLLSIAPRSILKRQVERAAALGFECRGASELEFYSFDDTFAAARERDYAGLKPASGIIEDYHILQATREEPLIGAARRHLRDSGVPVENSKGEWGLGQHELNVRFTDVLTMADRHTVYKQCLKEVADLSGRSVTFMAKPHTDQAGSSCHLHLSLWRDGKSAFPGSGDLAGIACTDAFRWFLGGWIAHASESMAFLAPNVNSYKRYQSGSWAPTKLAWSYDNRTAGFRVVGKGPSLRIECRIPGADCNPYLAFGASLAAGLDGIENKIEPPPIFAGDVYAAEGLEQIPASLRDATRLFSESAYARRSFGDDVVDHYAHFFANEQAAHDVAVTDWERRRYFEQI
ncbi:MAG: glutamine synthetase [Chlamydiales bacterium]|jgi:glutamine synthetase